MGGVFRGLSRETVAREGEVGRGGEYLSPERGLAKRGGPREGHREEKNILMATPHSVGNDGDAYTKKGSG